MSKLISSWLLRVAALAVILSSAPVLGQSQRARSQAAALEQQYPGVTVIYPYRDSEGAVASWSAAEQVMGRLMPASGETGTGFAASAQEAVTDWLRAHSAVFQGDGQLESLTVDFTRELPLRDGRVAVHFAQVIQDPRAPGEEKLEVDGVHGRAMVSELAEGWAVSYVSVAAVSVPEGGLADPLVTSEIARQIAATESMASRSGRLYSWAEPDLVVEPLGSGNNPREAVLVWRVSGGSLDETVHLVEVLVGAGTGEIRSEYSVEPAGAFSLNMQTPSVSGTVTGEILQTLKPWESAETVLPCSTFSTAIEGLPKFRVDLLDAAGGSIVATTYTNSSGYYAFNNQTITGTSHVRFTPEHENFALAEVTDIFEQVDPTLLVYAIWDELGGYEKSVPSSGATVDFLFADDRASTVAGGQFDVADATVYKTMHNTRDFLRSRFATSNNAYYPGIDDDDLRIFSTDSMITERPLYYRYASYFWRDFAVPTGATPELFGEPAIVFQQEKTCSCPGGTGATNPNFGYSTIVSHEYGHFALDEGFGIGYPGNSGIHEGYADVLSLLMHDPADDIIGDTGFGCLTAGPVDIRDWVDIESTWASATQAWKDGQICSAGQYNRAQRLVLVWLHLRDAIGVSDTAQLFADWSLIATSEPAGISRECYDMGITGSEFRDLSIRDATLQEMLIADDNNNTLLDGTPNDDDICAAFAAYDLPVVASPYCTESSGSTRCRADLNKDGVFDWDDFAIFSDWIHEGSVRADLNGDGSADIFDVHEYLELAKQCQ